MDDPVGISTRKGLPWWIRCIQPQDRWEHHRAGTGSHPERCHPPLPGLVLIEFGINDSYVFPWAKILRVALSS
jgi:hypothetical protein